MFTMKQVAVLITVFNRQETTIKGLRTLYTAISYLGDGYHFDIYLTDDGCTDGTVGLIKKEFPQVIIVKGTGSLFWGGGMNLAWASAIDSLVDYDYYLWYNDDSELFPDSLRTLFEIASDNVLVTGAFKGHDGNVSYGGKFRNDQLITPNGMPQEVDKMNGNLVLIPNNIFEVVGFIDNHYIHGGGDFDYGYKVKENGFNVLLTAKYVGIANRHDEFIPRYCNKALSLSERWRILHNPVYSPRIHFRFCMKREGLIKALIYFFIAYIGVFFPSFYVRVKKAIKGR